MHPSELIVAYKLLNLGYDVAFPITRKPYDLLVNVADVWNPRYWKVEVKSTVEKDGELYLDLRRTYWSNKGVVDKFYTQKDFDILAIHTTNTDEVIFIPFEKLPRTSVKLRRKGTKPKNSQGKGINWIEDYICFPPK